MRYPYGEIMLKQGDIKSMDEWDPDKEFCCAVMDRKFDYLWDFSKGITFVDRQYHDGNIDEMAKARIERHEETLKFNSFAQVRRWIQQHL